MVFRALLDCSEDAEFVRGNVSEIGGVELHCGMTDRGVRLREDAET